MLDFYNRSALSWGTRVTASCFFPTRNFTPHCFLLSGCITGYRQRAAVITLRWTSFWHGNTFSKTSNRIFASCSLTAQPTCQHQHHGKWKVIILCHLLELFPIECRETKTKVITLGNRNRCKQHNEPIRIRHKYT